MIKASGFGWLEEYGCTTFYKPKLSNYGLYGNAKRYSLPYFRKFRPEIYLQAGLVEMCEYFRRVTNVRWLGELVYSVKFCIAQKMRKILKVLGRSSCEMQSKRLSGAIIWNIKKSNDLLFG